MQKIVITKGLPASGKSTWAKEYVLNHQLFKRVNYEYCTGKFVKPNFLPGDEHWSKGSFTRNKLKGY